MSIRRVIASVLLCVTSVTSAAADVFLYVADGASEASLSGPRILVVAPGYVPPVSIRLTYDKTFGQRGYRIDSVNGDSAVAAALCSHIEVSGGLRRPDVTLRRITQHMSFHMQSDDLRHPNAIMVISDEASMWETPAGTIIEEDDSVYSKVSQLYDHVVGLPVSLEAPADVDPIFDFSRLAELVEYPEVARRSNLEGQVMVAALIAADGTVFSAVIRQTDHQVFNEAAVRAVLLTEFTPAMKNGVPVPMWVRIPIEFKLQ